MINFKFGRSELFYNVSEKVKLRDKMIDKDNFFAP